MCERDDCTSIANRRMGQTIMCAYLSETSPPTLRDHTGSYTLKCGLPANSIVEKNDLYLFHLVFDGEKQACTRITPIPTLLYPVYRKILDEYRKSRMDALKAMKAAGRNHPV
ncbi:unnamed protein product [Caenorhabditis sp. 36 PRJEB53466]|nr:unnamed protein product [Caenorhabditis sp. 36 PRJEB53466]